MPLTRDVFDGATAERRLADYFTVATTRELSARYRGWNSPPPRPASPMSNAPSSASGRRCLRHCAKVRGPALAIDAATRANLELIRTLSGERRGSLLAAIDRTVTAAGSRLLAQRLAAPLTDADAIARRLDAVALFVSDPAARGDMRAHLKSAPDLARALSRLVIGRGGPRDLAAIRDGLAAASELAARLTGLSDLPA